MGQSCPGRAVLPADGRGQGGGERRLPGAGQGGAGAGQKGAEGHSGDLFCAGGGAAGGSAADGPGHAGSAAPDGTVHPALSGGEGPAQRDGLFRPGALCHRPADRRPGTAHGAGKAGLLPLPGGDGGRIPGQQPGAELHFPGPVRGGATAVRRGRCEAEHLPVPAGGPHHFPGEIPVLPPGGGGGGGPAAKGAAEPEFPLPAGGAGRHQLCVPGHYVPGNGGDGLRRRRAAVFRRGGGVPAPAGHGAGAALDQRGEYGGGNLRPHGGGGPVCGPAHPTAAGPGLPGAGRGRTAPACGAGGYRHSHAVPPGASGGLYGGPAAGEHSLHQRGERGVFQHPGGGGDGVIFADHRQSAAGCAADRRAAVAAVWLFPGPAGPDPGAAAGGRLL